MKFDEHLESPIIEEAKNNHKRMAEAIKKSVLRNLNNN